MTKNASARYHLLQVTFHWLTVVLLFAMFPLGTYMSRLPNDAGKIALLTVHTILGSIILIIIIARFINRFRLPRPAHATAGNVFLDWIGAALYHQFVLKDNLLSRMWYKKKTGDQ